MSNFKYPKGSEWRKWDLHVHTKFDNAYKFSPETSISKREQDDNEYPKVFIEHIYSVQDLGAIAITDHNSANWIDKIIEENNNYSLPENKERITIFPGVEVESNDGIHLLVIFNPETQSDEVKKNFRRSSWKETIEHFLTSIRSEANPNANKSTEEIMEEAEKWDALCIFAHVTNKKGFFKISSGDRKIQIYKHKLTQIFQIPINGIADVGIKNIIEGKDPNYYDDEGNPKSICCITSSDAKNSTNIGRNNLWIKADPTFEGLKQIIYEPELRVKIQEEDPRENEVYARIEKSIIDFPSPLEIKTEEPDKKTDFCLSGKYEIEFSNNLTCIIGGRGIGKSTLVHLLYNKCEKKDTSRLENLNSPLLTLDLSPDSLSKAAELITAEIPTDTEFFLQNEIEKFARNIDEMSKLIRHRLLLRSSLGDQKSLKDLEKESLESLESMKNLIEAYGIISDITKRIKLVEKQINTLKNQVAVIQSEDYKTFQQETADISNKISQFKHYKTEYEEIISKIDIVVNTISKLNWGKEQGKGTLNKLSGLLKEYKGKLQETFSKVETDFKAKDYFTKLVNKKLQLKKYLERRGLKEENIEEIADASERIAELEDEIRGLEKQQGPYKEIYSKKESTLSKYKDKYDAYKNRFFKVTKNIEKELEGLPFFDKEIKFTPKINEQHLRESAVEFVKDNNPSKVSLRIDDIQTVLFSIKDITEYLTDKNKIRDCVNQSTKTVLHKQILQELVNDPVFLEKLYLLLWKEYYDISNIQVQTKLGDKLLQNTSFGERCGIVISIILIAGTNPIVIDQPEDNLDGKFISNVLVPLIRKRKFNRQIILITRDANIVIGGDAELIHILESDENEKKTKIVPSSIENIEYRENYIWILDGGKEAFEKREKKYGF